MEKSARGLSGALRGRGRPVKQKLRKAAIVVLLLVFVGSLGRIGWQLLQYRTGGESYDKAAELVKLPERVEPDEANEPDGDTGEPADTDPYAAALRDIDLTALQQVNSDVLGWIMIPDTNISYPVVQGDDNDYYLNHTWEKKWNAVGAIFMDWRCSGDLSGFNTILYGHRMKDRSMFGTLSSYGSADYWAAHPDIYLVDGSGLHRYAVFAAYEVSVVGTTYELNFADEASRQAFIEFCLSQSVIDTGVTPTADDRVLTLSTCTGLGHATRWVVQGVLEQDTPADAAQPEAAAG